jgi:hypothetical protein
MKIVRTEYLVCAGDFAESLEWERIQGDIACGIVAICRIKPGCKASEMENRSSRGKHAYPLWRQAFAAKLETLGWLPNVHFNNTPLQLCTPFDLGLAIRNGNFCVELATGDLSHTIMVLNKLTLGILSGVLVGGVMVMLNEERRAKFAAERLSFDALQMYFDVWKAVKVPEGLLVVIAAE